MRRAIKSVLKLLLTGLFSLTVGVSIAQIPVSKDVQRYANKKKFEKEKLHPKPKIQTVARPQITISKGVHGITRGVGDDEGNMISTGYPYWTVAKGVNKYHMNGEFRDAYVARKKKK